MAAHRIDLDFTATLGVRLNKRDAERLAKKLQESVMDAIDNIQFDAAPEPKGGLLLELSGGRPVITPMDAAD